MARPLGWYWRWPWSTNTSTSTYHKLTIWFETCTYFIFHPDRLSPWSSMYSTPPCTTAHVVKWNGARSLSFCTIWWKGAPSHIIDHRWPSAECINCVVCHNPTSAAWFECSIHFRFGLFWYHRSLVHTNKPNSTDHATVDDGESSLELSIIQKLPLQSDFIQIKKEQIRTI